MKFLSIVSLLFLVGSSLEAQSGNVKTLRLGTLEFTSSVTLVEDDKILRTSVRVRNQGRDTTQLLAPGDCAVFLLLYRQPGRGESPIWDGRQKDKACLLGLRSVTLAPDSSVTFVETDSVAVVGKRTTPGTRYIYSAILYLGRGGGSLELPTGGGAIP